MCGQAGLILGRKRRRAPEIAILKTIFTGLLMRSESRGIHASGVAVINRAGDYSLFKRPMRATQLIAQIGFNDALGAFDHTTADVLGHTRYRTRGTEANNANNHPLRSADWIGTCNGTILNADTLFRRHCLYRHAEVDSELILRLADRCSEDGRLDLPCFISALRPAQGQISAVFASLADPSITYILHGNRPLVLRAHCRYRAIAYASEARFLDEVLGDLPGWRDFPLPPMTLARFDHEDIFHPEFHRIAFIAKENMLLHDRQIARTI